MRWPAALAQHGRMTTNTVTDTDTAQAHLADDGRHRGKGEVLRFFEAIASTIDISEFEIVAMTSNQTDVVVTVHWTFTVKATAKTARMYMQHWWRFSDGKSLFRGSEDTEQSAAAGVKIEL
jgi:hypothetical protein